MITGGIAIVCLFLYIVFPVSNVFQRIISSLTFLFLIPFLYVKIILKKEMKGLGFRIGNWQTGVTWSVISLIGSVLITYVLFEYFNFSEKYPFPQYLTNNFLAFVSYEIFLVGFFVALYEFFFRGFLMLGVLKKTGVWSIFLQAFVFLLLLLAAGGISWALVPYIIFSFFSGAIVYLSRSILYSFISNTLFIVIVDSIFVHISKNIR